MEISPISVRVLRRYTLQNSLISTIDVWKGFCFIHFLLDSLFSYLTKPSLQRIALSLNKEGPWLVQHSWTVTLTDWKATNLQWTNNRTLWPLAPPSVVWPHSFVSLTLVLDMLPTALLKIWCHLNIFLQKLISPFQILSMKCILIFNIFFHPYEN